jgi:hypothetical protein
MNCLIQKITGFWSSRVYEVGIYYYRYPSYRTSYDPDYCFASLMIRLIFWLLLGAFIGIVIGRLINAILARIEGKPVKEVIYRTEQRQGDDKFVAEKSELPDEYLQRKQRIRYDEDGK